MASIRSLRSEFAQSFSSSCCSAAISTAPSGATMHTHRTKHAPLFASLLLAQKSSDRQLLNSPRRRQERGGGRGRVRRVRWPLSTRHRRQRSSACQKRLVTASDMVAGTRLMHIFTQQPTSASVRRAVATPFQVTPYRLGTMPNARLPHRAYLGHRARPPLHPLAHATSPMPPAGGLEHVHVRPAARVFIACLPSATHHPPYPLETASLT